MPIVVDRKTGRLISAPEYSQEQIDRALAVVAKAWAQSHPELYRPAAIPAREKDVEGN